MPKIRAIRFSDKEEKTIQAFLKSNPMFDFSTLARTAIIKFMDKPELQIKSSKDIQKFNKEATK